MDFAPRCAGDTPQLVPDQRGLGVVVIDWGDSTVGNPAFDILRLCDDVDPAAATDLRASWAARWRAAVPSSDPDRAIDLLRPVAAVRAAAAYAEFLSRIEPSEHPYHAADVPHWLDVARQERARGAPARLDRPTVGG